MRPLRCRGNTIQYRMASIMCLLMMLLMLPSCATGPVRNEPGRGMAVWDLENLSPGGSRLDIGELLSAQVVAEIKKRNDYTLVERTRLVRVLEELRLGSSSLADEQARLRVGKLVGARLMVFGGYMLIGTTMRIDLRLVEVETGKVLKAVQKTALSNDISGWLDAAGKAAAEL